MLVYQRVSSQNIFGCGIQCGGLTQISPTLWTDLGNASQLHLQKWRTFEVSQAIILLANFAKIPLGTNVFTYQTLDDTTYSTSKWDGSSFNKTLEMGMVEILCLHQRFQFGAPRRCPFFLMGRALKIPLETAPLTGLRVSGYPIFGWNDTKFRVGVFLHETNPTKDWTVATWTPKNIKKH